MADIDLDVPLWTVTISTIRCSIRVKVMDRRGSSGKVCQQEIREGETTKG